MSEFLEARHEKPAPDNAPVDRRPDGLGPLGSLQMAGNRAVTQFLQREPLGYRPKPDNPYQLHLDPEIEAQIRAINAMNAMIAPEQVHAGLLDLNLTQLPPAPAPTATPQLPAPSAPATPTGPAPGTGLMGPRPGTAGDVWKAVLAEPSLGPAIVALGDQAAAQAKADFSQLSTGGKVAVVSGAVTVVGGALVGVLSSPDARQWITATLNDKIIPVPKVPGLSVQLNLSGDTMIVGLHLDVGKILPASLGFGPASATTPLGAPPNPYESVQRQVIGEPAGLVIQRDPIAGGAAGQTSDATGGAIGLRSIEGSFVLPAGKVLSGTTSRIVKTAESATITVKISSDKVVLGTSGIYIDAQWPVQNMRLYEVTHDFASGATTSDVRLVDDEFGDGFIDATGTARSSIGELIGTIIARTALDPARRRPPPDPSLDTRRPPGPQPPPETFPKPAFVPPAAYDPLRDTDPQETLQALITNLQAMPSDGTSDVGAQDISKISVGATIVVNNGFEQIEGGTGLKMAPGTAVTVQIDSGASVSGLQGAGKGAAGIAAAANIQAIHVSSSGIEVVKDGKLIASITHLTLSRGGRVKIDNVLLHGEAAEAAESERGFRLLAGAVGGLAQTNGVPFGAAAGVARTAELHEDTPTVVPGIVSGLLESKLQAAFTDLLAKQGRTVIPGVDLGSVLGVPGAPVSPK